MNDMDKIELRSEKVRKIIGDMPSGFYPSWYQHHYLHNYLSIRYLLFHSLQEWTKHHRIYNAPIKLDGDILFGISPSHCFKQIIFSVKFLFYKYGHSDHPQHYQLPVWP